MMEKQAATQFFIQQVTDLEQKWSEIEPLVLGQIEYHRAWDSRRLRDDWSTRMREFMANRGVTLLARNSTGRAIGFINGEVARDFAIFEEATGHISNAFVVDEERRHGVGVALLARFEDWCLEQGADEIRLEVAHGNDVGLNFWQKSGYAVSMHEMRKSLEAAR
jgi:GNAT superfamily N-acetyltransferase